MIKWLIFALVLQFVVITAAEYNQFQEICLLIGFVQVTIAVGVTEILKVLKKDRGQ